MLKKYLIAVCSVFLLVNLSACKRCKKCTEKPKKVEVVQEAPQTAPQKF